ncbi:MAG: ABC transporter substrate-binding protein [Telluria sp.]
MSTVLAKRPAPSGAQAAPALTEALFTICPVLVASNVAVEFGWLEEEFKKVGAKATYLRSLADNKGWIPHYTHSLPNLFRDGGAIPTIEAKADLADTTLIGLTWAQSGGQILVRAGAGIGRVKDLKGRRIGLFKSLNTEKIDFIRATAHQGIVLALDLAGLSAKDVQIVDLDDADRPTFNIASKPAELWPQYRSKGVGLGREAEALADGSVDAIYANLGRASALLASGKFTVIEDLERHPDWTLQIANGPYTTAVNTEFAKAHPEAVVAFLRAAIRAGRWINANRDAAAHILARTTLFPSVDETRRALAGHDLIPTLSPKNLAGIGLLKDFLRQHGYVKNDFDVQKWADARYLEAALRTA